MHWLGCASTDPGTSDKQSLVQIRELRPLHSHPACVDATPADQCFRHSTKRAPAESRSTRGRGGPSGLASRRSAPLTPAG